MPITDQEFNLLPEFLQVRVAWHNKIDHPGAKKWNTKTLGKDYIHYHHWAAGIIKFHRALNPDNAEKKNYWLNYVLSEYGYLLRHCTQENQFRYIFHMKRGEVYYIQGKYSLAGEELQKSLNYKDDNRQTYIVLSKVYEALDMKKQAKEALRRANSLKSQ